MSAPLYPARERYQDRKVAGDYDQERFASWFGKLADRAESGLLERAINKYFTAGTVLDLPCGTGRLLNPLIESGLEVTGGDISLQMMAVAQARYKGKKNIRFEKVDAENLSFPPNHFDYLTSFRLMTHLPPEVRQKVLGEMVRVTRKMLVINYHLDCFSPLNLWNRIFRPGTCPLFTLNKSQMLAEIGAHKNIEICDIWRLSAIERTSHVVILKKAGN